MTSRDLSRREFVALATAGALSGAGLRAQTASPTAEAMVDRIRSSVGLPWREKTADGFKAGEPATVVTGIATTTMASVDVLKRAVAARQNFVVTLEPTFYSADDTPGQRTNDPIYLAKKKLIDDSHLVVWRFAEHWNARQPGEAVTALAAALGWKGAPVAGTDAIYQIPETTLRALIAHVRTTLNVRGSLRVVGDLTSRVRTVFVSPGTTDTPKTVQNLARADVVLAGEPREWEAVPYTLDTLSAGAGRAKGLISIGRIVSETPSAAACAAWIRTLAPNMPVAAVPAGDPYWSPGA